MPVDEEKDSGAYKVFYPFIIRISILISGVESESRNTFQNRQWLAVALPLLEDHGAGASLNTEHCLRIAWASDEMRS